MRKQSLFFICLPFLIIMTGCANRIGDLSIVSTRNYTNQGKHVLVTKDATGESMTWGVIMPFGIPNIEDAIEDATRGSDADYLLNAVIYYKTYGICPIIWKYGYSVNGDAYKIE